MSSFKISSFVYVCCVSMATVAVDWAVAFPYGAPAEACGTMKPGHLFPPKPEPSPFAIETLTSEMTSGTLEITLKSQAGVTFKGFLLMAFDNSTSDDSTPLGTFSTDSSGLSQHLECGNPQGALTHTNPKEKSSLTVTWTPPRGYEGFVVFKATFVKSFGEYWVKQRSRVVQVISSLEHSTNFPFSFNMLENSYSESPNFGRFTTQEPRIIENDASFTEDSNIEGHFK